jgi:DNA-binding YbaB/EbfC family protein
MVSGFGDMSSLLKQAQMMQKKMQDTERELGERVVEGTAGGGAVTVFLNGLQEVQAVKIDKAAVDPDDVETLEDLVRPPAPGCLAADLRQREMARSPAAQPADGLEMTPREPPTCRGPFAQHRTADRGARAAPRHRAEDFRAAGLPPAAYGRGEPVLEARSVRGAGLDPHA